MAIRTTVWTQRLFPDSSLLGDMESGINRLRLFSGAFLEVSCVIKKMPRRTEKCFSECVAHKFVGANSLNALKSDPIQLTIAYILKTIS